MPVNVLKGCSIMRHGCRSAIFLVLLQAIHFVSAGQQAHSGKKVITSEFNEKEVIFDRSSIISNVLKIKNNNGKPYQMRLQVSVPGGWKSLVDEDRVIEIYPSDSVFVPVRVVPNFSSVTGSTKYTINVAVQSVDGKIMSTSFFYASKPAISNWEMKILPQPRIYFRNDENSADFQVSLANNGDEPKNILLAMSTIGRGISVGDSLFQPLRKSYTELFLLPNMDTLLPYSVTIEKMKRNYKRVDIDGYLPNQTEEERSYMLFAKAGEIGNSQKRVEHNQKVDFIKLSNNINFVKLGDNLKLNQYGSATIPLVADLNIYNILSGTQPLANLNLYGNTRTALGALVNYQLQSNMSGLSSGSPGKQTYGTIGYFTGKGYMQGGNTGAGLYGIQGVSGGVGGGLGVSAGYYFSPFRKIAGYLSEGASGPYAKHTPNYGAAYQGRVTKRIKYAAAYKHSDNGISTRADIVQATTSFSPVAGQSLSFSGNNATNNNYLLGRKTNGNSVGISYNGSFFDRMLTTSINASNYSKEFTGTGLGNTIGSANTYLRTKGKWSFSLQDQYSAYDNYYSTGTIQAIGQNKVIYNQLNFNKRSETPLTVGYFLFYNYTDFDAIKIDDKGVGINGNYYQADKNIRVQMLLKGGINREHDSTHNNFFSAQYFSLINYRTLFFNINYNYSAQTISNTGANTVLSNYPQQVLLSLSHQLQAGKQLIWENNVSYNYLSTLEKSSLGFFSTLYFYTYSGWRLKLEAGYNRSSSQSYQYDYTGNGAAPVLTPSTDKVTSSGSQINIGLRKQLGIKLPARYAKQKFCNAKFVAFLDLNGNKIMDKDEVPLENIVIRLNEFEILTNKTGQAAYENAVWGKYRLQAFSLTDLGAWFPVISDSIDLSNISTYYIPFSKGVKIQGNIELQREKYSGELYNIDLSKIKITLSDSSSHSVLTSITDPKGNFSFYAPYGKYTLSMDEDVLSSEFTIAQNNVNVDLLDGMDNFYYTFFVLENKRRVTKKRFDANGQLISENTDVADVYTGDKKGNTAGDANGKPGNNINTAGSGINTAGSKERDTIALLKRDEAKLANSRDAAKTNTSTTRDTIALFKRDEGKVARKTPSPDAEKLKEIDEKITRLDSVGNVLLKNSASGFYTASVPSGTGGPKLQPADATNKKLSGFTIEVAYYPNGENIMKRLYSGLASADKGKTAKEAAVLLDGINSGELQWFFHADGGTSIIYGGFRTKQEAFIKRSNLLKMGYPADMKVKTVKDNKLQ